MAAQLCVLTVPLSVEPSEKASATASDVSDSTPVRVAEPCGHGARAGVQVAAKVFLEKAVMV
jgi:hypothetical protein